MTTQEQKLQAATILKQLGGNKFIMMTGANNFICDEKGIGFRFMRNKLSAQFCRIELNSLDLYPLQHVI